MLLCSPAFGFSTSAVNAAVTSCCGVICWLPVDLLTTTVKGSWGGGGSIRNASCEQGHLLAWYKLLSPRSCYRAIGWQWGRLWGMLAGPVQAVTGQAVYELYDGSESTWEQTKLCDVIMYKYYKSKQCRQGSTGSSCVSVGSISSLVVLTCVSLSSARVVAGLGCCNMFPPPSICQPLLRAQHLSPKVMFSLYSSIWELQHFVWCGQAGREEECLECLDCCNLFIWVSICSKHAVLTVSSLCLTFWNVCKRWYMKLMIPQLRQLLKLFL